MGQAARFESEVSEVESSEEASAETVIAQAEAAMASTPELEEALAKSKEKLAAVEAQCSALTEQRGFLENELVILRKHVEKVSEREFQGGMERHRLECLLQETRAELESSAAAITAAAEAEKEAATRAKRESLSRERAESSAEELKERAVAAEGESTELREEMKCLGVRLREASEREKTLRDLLATMGKSKVTAEQETGNVGENIAEVRSELVEARRRAEEGETEVKVLTGQAAALSQEVEGARERERRMREEMVALRGKVMMLESNAGLVSSEAEKKERALRNELQARDARIFELEAQMKALTSAQERLAKTRDTLVDDALQAQDLLCGAAERVRRSRSMGFTGRARHPAASMVGELRARSPVSMSTSLRVEDLVSNGALAASVENDRRNEAVTAAKIEGNEWPHETPARGRPPTRVLVDSSLDFSVGTRRNHQTSSYLSASRPIWGSGGERASEERGLPNKRTSMHTEGEMDGGNGDGVTAAALDMVREVERLQAAMWELEQNERILTAKLEDMEEARVVSEAARRGAEDRVSSAASERDNFAAKVKVLEDQLEEVQAVSARLRERVDRAEPEVEDLNAKLRAGKDDIRRLRGQLEATGLSDSAMMDLLRGRDAALAAAAARTSALEMAKEELEVRAVEAEDRQRKADRLAESVRGQLEGLGTFDRRTSMMLEQAEEELSRMRVQASETASVIERLKDLLAASNAKAQSLAMELDESEKAVVTSNELLTQAEEAATAMRSRLSNVEEELKKEARKAAEAEENASSLSGTVEVKWAQVISLEKAKRHQEDLLREKDRALLELQNEVESLRVQITADSRKAKEAEEISLARVAEATFRSESAAEEVETLKKRLQEAEGESREAHERWRALFEQVGMLTTELGAKRDSIEQLTSALKAAEDHRDCVKRNCADLNRRFEQLKGEIADQYQQYSLEVEHASVAAAREDLASTREKLNSANAELETARAEIVALSAVRDNLGARLSQEIAAAEEAKATSEAAAKEACEIAVESALKAAAEEFAATEAALRERINTQKEKSLQELQAAFNFADEAEAEAREAFKKQEAMALELRAVRNRLEVAETAVQQGNEEKKELEERICMMEEEAKGHQERNQLKAEALRQHLRDTERTLADTREELAESKTTMEKQNQALAEMEVSLLSEREAAKAAEEMATASAAAASESAAARETTLLSELSFLRTSTEATKKDLDEKVAVLRARVYAAEHIAEEQKAEAAEAAAAATASRASEEATAKAAAEAAETAARHRAMDCEAIGTLKAALKELGAALTDERLRRNGEMTEIKSMVDEIMTLHLGASGGGEVIRHGDVLSDLTGIGASEVRNRGGNPNRLISVVVNQEQVEHEVGASTFSATNVAGMAPKLIEAYSLLEATEARQKRLQEALKESADRETRLREALATAEAIAEERAREGRLLAASLQDAREGLLVEEAARREAESRAEVLRYSGVGEDNNEFEEEPLFGCTREDAGRNARSERTRGTVIRRG